ncbi:hypothetical protein LCGC14_2831670, partial [marine sediment metagenome]
MTKSITVAGIKIELLRDGRRRLTHPSGVVVH